MKAHIFIFCGILLSSLLFGQKVEDVDVYDCINKGLVPYLKSNNNTDILISTYPVKTFSESKNYYNLYEGVLSFLKKEFHFDQSEIEFMKSQYEYENERWKWKQKYVQNATISENLNYYEDYHFSKPVISADKKSFVIILKRTPPSHGRCGTVESTNIPMLFHKENSQWSFVKSFEDEGEIYRQRLYDEFKKRLKE